MQLISCSWKHFTDVNNDLLYQNNISCSSSSFNHHDNSKVVTRWWREQRRRNVAFFFWLVLIFVSSSWSLHPFLHHHHYHRPWRGGGGRESEKVCVTLWRDSRRRTDSPGDSMLTLADPWSLQHKQSQYYTESQGEANSKVTGPDRWL